MKSRMNNSSNLASVNSTVDKENTLHIISVPSNQKTRVKQKNARYQKIEEIDSESYTENTEDMKLKNSVDSSRQLTLSERLESVEKKFLNLQFLKENTNIEFSSLLSELNELIPLLNQMDMDSSSNNDDNGPDSKSDKESGLSKLLDRLHRLQQENQKRRSVSEKKLQFNVKSINERYEAEVMHNQTEFSSELAETSVALIHKHMMSKNINSTLPSQGSLESITETVSSNPKSILSSRKRSLPAINQPVTTCPISMKMARRQSVAAVPQNLDKLANRKYNDPSVLNNFNANSLLSPKSDADTDLLTIKYRISKALKR